MIDRSSRIIFQPFPMDLSDHLEKSVSTGTLTLTLPWICDILLMMDTVCVSLRPAKEFLAALNEIYVQVNRIITLLLYVCTAPIAR